MILQVVPWNADEQPAFAGLPMSEVLERLPATMTHFSFSVGLIGRSALFGSVVLGCSVGLLRGDEVDGKELARLPIEDLMDLKVTSVSKHEERLQDAPAAVSVLTGDEIRRAGALTLQDALRLVPGLSVAQSDDITWGISARGFNDQFANKLLVLIDGRSVYNQLFSGVFWELQDVFLDDLDRIEVVRGPGSTLWGANAVNGVINVTSKSSKDTQGVALRVGGGDLVRADAGLRYGGRIGEDLYFRIYGQHRVATMSDHAFSDDPLWNSSLGGIRLDWEPGDRSKFTLQGAYGSTRPESVEPTWLLTPPYAQEVESVRAGESGHVIGRWTHEFTDDVTLTWQNYGDWYSLHTYESVMKQLTFDTEASLHFSLGERNQFTVGAGYRRVRTEMDGSYNLGLGTRPRYDTGIANGFVQDEIDLVEDRLKLTLGAKLEHQSLTGPELMPNVRLAWKATDQHTLWAAVSRAVRTPSIAEYDISSTVQVVPPGISPNPLPVPLVYRLQGSRDVSAESLIAYEVGWKFQPNERFNVNVSAFYNDYHDQLSLEPQPPSLIPAPTPRAEVQLLGANLARAESYGGEIEATWKPVDQWKLRGSVSLVDTFVHVSAGSLDQGVFAEGQERRSPVWQTSLHSSFDFPWHLTLDNVLRFSGEVDGGTIPAYVTMDARLAWEFRSGCELAIVGRNLLDDRHPEFTSSSLKTTFSTEVQRSVFATLSLRF
jgi:iron complex outermembrane receptor protein